MKAEFDELIPTIYFITPTFYRLNQQAELTRISQTLRHVANLVWVIIEDSDHRTSIVTNLLANCGVKSVHLNVTDPKMGHNVKPKGFLQRNYGLSWVKNEEAPKNRNAVVYFGDDDNTYSLRLFDEVGTSREPNSSITVTSYARHGFSNHQQLDWLFNGSLITTTTKTSKLHITDPFEGNHRWPMNLPHEGPVKRNAFPCYDVIVRLFVCLSFSPTNTVQVEILYSNLLILFYSLDSCFQQYCLFQIRSLLFNKNFVMMSICVQDSLIDIH